MGIVGKRRVVEVGGDIGERAAGIAGDEFDDAGGLRCEAPDIERVIQEEGGDAGAVEQVLDVVAGE